MASGGPGFDQTEWSGLLRGARDGKLRMVHVDSGRLGELTSACEDFLADVQGFIDASLSVNFSKFSWTHDNKDPADGTPQPKARHVVTTLSSMAMLFEKFERKRTVELVEVLKNHQAIVRVMGDTFVAANKKYVVMDGANANTFVAPERGTDLWPEIFRHYSVPASDWKAGPAFSTKAGSGVSFDVGVKGMVEGVVENGKSFDLIGFANIAEMLGRNSAGVYWLAGQWRALADIWRVSVQKFMDRVGPVFKGQYWEGVGADRAVAFVEKYVQATDTLYSGLLSMSNVVGNTADFNAFVRSHLPLYEHLYFNSDGSVSKVDADNGNDTNAGRHLPRVQTFWDSGDGTSDQKGYVLGIKQLAGLVPVFNDPNKLAGAQGDLPGSFNYRGPSGDGRGGGGTGDGSGGNSGGGSGGGTGGKSGGPTGAEGGGKGDGGAGGGVGKPTGADGGKGTGDGGGSGGKSTGDNGSSPGRGTGPEGSTGAPGTGIGGGTGGAPGNPSSNDLMSLFSEALQLISSGIGTLVQLGNQLAAQLGPALQQLAKAVENGTMTVKQALEEGSKRIEEQLEQVEEQLFPPGADGPVVSFALLPGGDEPQVRIEFPGRAGGRRTELVEDFTATRSTTAVTVEPAQTGAPAVPGVPANTVEE
ncbi:hypothetical protein F5X71_08125 [Nocardia brasiliensis]|uniref:Uncharacterized protein n=1 Tax=Nocardia brasiliensis TaxID=37326 RepID=A0A6G9XN05_NOCBR|nr:hypothetical protein [Nocardia brasiliensis]QIS02294.1 hypothetical protein F5X71_08125 [Nocardia brasiliensis]